MKKKGFTLIELLAVIIILAIIALIATPIILDVVENSRKSASKSSAAMILSATKDYYAENYFNDTFMGYECTIHNRTGCDNIQVSGDKPDDAIIRLSKSGTVEGVVTFGNYTYYYFDGKITEHDDCSIGYVGTDNDNPTIALNLSAPQGTNNWYTGNSISINAQDLGSGVDRYLWCVGIDCEPENIEYENKTITIPDAQETQLCVIAYDRANNASDKTCSNVIKVDTVKPEINGIADLTVAVGTNVDLTAEATDTTSGIESFTYSPSTVDTSKSGIVDVTYTAIDKAGNTKQITRKVTISSSAPTITFTPAANAINSNGWAKEDFYVTINVIDNSGHGIKEFRVCTAVTDTCDPENGSLIENSSTATRLISTENNNNRICVKAIDNTDQETETICSDAFKLDKHVSIAGTILVNNASPSTDWYNSNLTITPVDGSDSLSGHATTTVDVSSITESTSGTTVTVTTTDNAGNSKTRSYTLKVDKTEPTVNVTKTANNNKNLLTATVTPATTISGYNYQWYKDDVAIDGATSATYEATEAGTFKVVVTTGAGKTVTSNGVTVNSYTITYNVNGGSGTIASTTKVENVPVNITSSTPTKSGFTFLGWSTSNSATSATYAKGAEYTANSGTTLYAIWRKTVTMTYSKGTGVRSIGKTSDTCYIYNSNTSCSIKLPSITAYSGYDVLGWYTSSGTRKGGSSSTISVSSSMSLTAKAEEQYYDDECSSSCSCGGLLTSSYSAGSCKSGSTTYYFYCYVYDNGCECCDDTSCGPGTCNP